MTPPLTYDIKILYQLPCWDEVHRESRDNMVVLTPETPNPSSDDKRVVMLQLTLMLQRSSDSGKSGSDKKTLVAEAYYAPGTDRFCFRTALIGEKPKGSWYVANLSDPTLADVLLARVPGYSTTQLNEILVSVHNGAMDSLNGSSGTAASTPSVSMDIDF